MEAYVNLIAWLKKKISTAWDSNVPESIAISIYRRLYLPPLHRIYIIIIMKAEW